MFANSVVGPFSDLASTRYILVGSR